jgi:hypothetical protein
VKQKRVIIFSALNEWEEPKTVDGSDNQTGFSSSVIEVSIPLQCVIISLGTNQPVICCQIPEKEGLYSQDFK